MSLLYPIALFALAGLAIPLIIHLWNVKQGKTLKIGSIALLGDGVPLNSRSYRIADWLLLLLRLLLITLLVFLLAGPYLKRKAGGGNEKGWILMEKNSFSAGYKAHQKEIDTLLKAGYQLHRFDMGFPIISLKDTLIKDSSVHLNSMDYHSMFRQLNETLPAGFPVYLYASQRLNKLSGDLPSVDFNLKWKAINVADTLSHWTRVLSGKTYEATSSPSLTSYRNLDEGKAAPVISVLIYKGTNAEDAKYINAALAAIADFTKRKIELKQWNGQDPGGLKFDLGFWLSEQKVADGFMKQLNPGGRLFSYESGKTVSIPTEIDLQPGKTGPQPIVELNKRVVATSYPGTGIWNDGFGQTLLSFERKAGIDHYHFYSRLNPSWTTLVWKEAFVKAFMPIVIGQDADTADFGFENHPDDQRRSTNLFSQKQASIKTGLLERTGQKEPLNKYFWMLALAVFVLERMLSFYKQNKISHA
ncbi:BatA domain-containing protein [Pedobacter caeni]|uniref:N-terminal double-transmembrane domain-containing protein n=1 Tax=Pedobacter caeni TaxID=288992 RepID=A0A1M4VWU3_9SPHI|nr:BatA domain-containing protein [Pedobacter caeni]SHE73380.1 N-terminal double-transmembrane domain-containing protein [Pedobacter caeni]